MTTTNVMKAGRKGGTTASGVRASGTRTSAAAVSRTATMPAILVWRRLAANVERLGATVFSMLDCKVIPGKSRLDRQCRG